MNGALMSFFLSSCLCCVHVLASFVHITKANVKRFFSKFHARCDVNILQELKIYGCTAATFHWSISWNHSFILPDVLEMVVVIKKKNLYGTNIHKQQINVRILLLYINIHTYIYILYILLVSMCDKKLTCPTMKCQWSLLLMSCSACLLCVYFGEEKGVECSCFCVCACVLPHCFWHSHVFGRCL